MSPGPPTPSPSRQVANLPPSFGDGPLSREIPENSAAGTAVGAAVTATDPDTGDTLTLQPERD